MRVTAPGEPRPFPELGGHVDKLARRTGAEFGESRTRRRVVCRRRSARRSEAAGIVSVIVGADGIRAHSNTKPESRTARGHTTQRSRGSLGDRGWEQPPGLCSETRLVGDIGGEFDPGSGSTLAACLMHASRAGRLFGGAHAADGCGTRGQPALGRGIAVGNCGQFRIRSRVRGTGEERVFGPTPGGACGRLAGRGGNGLPWR